MRTLHVLTLLDAGSIYQQCTSNSLVITFCVFMTAEGFCEILIYQGLIVVFIRSYFYDLSIVSSSKHSWTMNWHRVILRTGAFWVNFILRAKLMERVFFLRCFIFDTTKCISRTYATLSTPKISP